MFDVPISDILKLNLATYHFYSNHIMEKNFVGALATSIVSMQSQDRSVLLRLKRLEYITLHKTEYYGYDVFRCGDPECVTPSSRTRSSERSLHSIRKGVYCGVCDNMYCEQKLCSHTDEHLYWTKS
jgi:hypothetical protein